MAERNYVGPPLITAELPAIELNLLKINLEDANAALIQRAVDWAVSAGMDVLEHALPLTPWDSGKLRRSGTVTVDYGARRIDVARGTKEGKLKTLSGLSKLTPTLARRIRKRVKSIRAIVHFHRIADSNEGPRDIALWTHENLNPYGSGTAPSAVKPGTGPKYLERAGKMRSGTWNAKVRDFPGIIDKDFRDMATVQSSKLKGITVVARLRLKLNRLKRFVFKKRR